jgi:2-polyprenyl-3-methyl-5-hydroxy-6-metoxy-1,4-benzoquinol methylase
VKTRVPSVFIDLEAIAMTDHTTSASNQGESRGWKSRQEKVTAEITDFSWLEGYFHNEHYGWDGKTWKRNFHELRTRDIAVMALGDIRGKRILDVGCGDGTYALVLSNLGAKVHGQDLSEEAIERSKRLFETFSHKPDLKIGDATALQFPSESFDCVFSADFVEHIDIEQKRKVIREIYRVLVPGGALVIKTPNLSYLRLSIFLKRIAAVLRLRTPFIYITNTRNNPDNEHHGLTTYAVLREELEANFFHTPKFHHQPLVRSRLPGWATDLLLWFKMKVFSEHIIISTRKSSFVGFSDLMAREQSAP